jgi:hypothetical protein
MLKGQSNMRRVTRCDRGVTQTKGDGRVFTLSTGQQLSLSSSITQVHLVCLNRLKKLTTVFAADTVWDIRELFEHLLKIVVIDHPPTIIAITYPALLDLIGTANSIMSPSPIRPSGLGTGNSRQHRAANSLSKRTCLHVSIYGSSPIKKISQTKKVLGESWQNIPLRE